VSGSTLPTGSSVECRAPDRPDVPAILDLWKSRYRRAANGKLPLPEDWLLAPAQLTGFLEQHVGNGAGLVAERDGVIVGYMFYDQFEFHAELSSFVPIVAHGAANDRRLSVYAALYRTLSAELVRRGSLNHLMTFYADDTELREFLFTLGFGGYAVDAYVNTADAAKAISSRTEKPADEMTIRAATTRDLDLLYPLIRESDSYYAEPPLFLKREGSPQDEVADLLASRDGAVFLALADGSAVGFMNIRRSDEVDPITLVDTSTALIDPLGAYIVPELRGHGLGRALLAECFEWAQQEGLPRIHVDFESANPCAYRFWPLYFTPTLLSLKRSINADAS
jgi:GNAT superfamily N-acetyltransferase